MAESTIRDGHERWFERKGPPRHVVTDDLNGLPELWTRCSGCQTTLANERLQATLWVCPGCQTHLRMPAADRIHLLADPGSIQLWPDELVARDTLAFVDEQPYTSRLDQSRAKTGRNDAVHAASITMGGRRVELAVMDFAFMGGSMGAVVGEQLTRTIERGIQQRVPVVIVCASGGARMQEGVLSLMQMAKVSAALAALRDQARQPYCSILTHPTTGGVAASFAMLGDVILAEPGALIGFAGPRVIKQTIGQVLPPDFQRAEFLEAHGMVDRIVARSRLREELSFLLSCFSMGLSVNDAGRMGTATVAYDPSRRIAVPAAEVHPGSVGEGVLTEREMEILQCVADGMSNKDIGEEVCLSPATVKWYASRIFEKLHVKSRTEAVARARRMKLLR